MISRVLCSIHFRKNEMLACYPNWPECERDRGLFAIRRLYEPKVDELFLTHLLVLPSTRIFFERSVFDQHLVQRQAGGPQP